MEKRYIGTTEDRINKWMRMCLHWQFDIRRGIEKKSSHYYTKYHVGKYPKKWFVDLKDSVVDRDYVINKMNLISEDRMKRDRSLGQKSNKVIIKQVEIPNYTINHYNCLILLSIQIYYLSLFVYHKLLYFVYF